MLATGATRAAPPRLAAEAAVYRVGGPRPIKCARQAIHVRRPVIHHSLPSGAASTSETALALDPRAVARALGGRVLSRHGILALGPGHSLHDATVLAKALLTTAQPTGTA